MDLHSAPLRTPADLERALAEARRMLPGLEQAGPAETARFQALLQRIAEFRSVDPPAPRDPDLEQRQSLDGHLKAFGRRWGQEGDAGRPGPWKSMLGGDLRPKRPREG